MCQFSLVFKMGNCLLEGDFFAHISFGHWYKFWNPYDSTQ